MKMTKTRAVDSDGELKIERVPARARQVLCAAKSLRPGPAMMEAAASGNPEAIAIRDAWKLSFPIRVVSRKEFEQICARGETTFNG
ncbi:MAG: hypothetical protein JST61_15885 [Acidobacteria bacterium]|nr:hypothetical protein [Acidobacteriota bacterium]